MDHWTASKFTDDENEMMTDMMIDIMNRWFIVVMHAKDVNHMLKNLSHPNSRICLDKNKVSTLHRFYATLWLWKH